MGLPITGLDDWFDLVYNPNQYLTIMNWASGTTYAPWNPTTPYYTFTSNVMTFATLTGYVN